MPSKNPIDDLLSGGGKGAKLPKPPSGAGNRIDDLLSGRKTGGGSGGKDGKRSFLGNVRHAGGSALGGALNVLDRPVQGVKSLIKDAREDAGTGETLSHLSHALTGHGELTTQEALGTKVKGPAGTALNFIGDVALDPTTYLSFGTTAAAKVGLKATKEVGEELVQEVIEKGSKKALTGANRAKVRALLASAEGGSEEAADKVLRKLDAGGRGGVKFAGHTVVSGARLKPVTGPVAKLGRGILHNKQVESIVPRGGVARTLGKDAADDVGAASARGRAFTNNTTAETLDRIAKVAKAANVEQTELPAVLAAIDVGGTVAALPARLRPLATDLRKIIDETTDKQTAAEVLSHAREDYVPRYLTPEAAEFVGDDAFRYAASSPEPASVMRQGGRLKERRFMADAPLAQANEELTKRLRAAGFTGDAAYEMDPLLITARRAQSANRAVAQRTMFDEIAQVKRGGESILRKADDGPKPLGWEEFDAGPLGRFVAPRELRKELEHVRSVIVNDDALREFRGFLGELNTLWKGYATVPIVGGFGFHMRNAQGNIFNNFLAGVKNPAVYARAAKIQSGRGLSAADQRVLDLAKKHGVIDEGFFIQELSDPRRKGGKLARAVKGDGLARPLKGGTLNPLSTENAIIRSGRRVGSAIENNARLAHFIDKLGKLGSADEAARSVRKYLFDYGDLTDRERGLKKVMAFYTFMRKNTPLQVQELFRQPGKYTAVAHSYNNAAMVGQEGDYPEWAIKEGLVPVGDGGLLLGFDSPFKAATQTLDPFQQSEFSAFSGLLPALAKYGIEEKTGKSLFSGYNTTGSTPQRLTDAALPLLGKIRRGPGRYLPTGAGIGLNSDDREQDRARLIQALTGLLARVNTENQ